MKNFQQMQQKLENAFLVKFSVFWDFRNFIFYGIIYGENYLWKFTSSIDASDSDVSLIPSVGGKLLKNYSKIHFESTKFGNQCIEIGC